MTIRTPTPIHNFDKLTGKEIKELLRLTKWKWNSGAVVTRKKPDLDDIGRELLEKSSTIPLPSVVEEAFHSSSRAPFSKSQDSRVYFSGFGSMESSLLPRLMNICSVMKFAESLVGIEEWLANCCDDESRAFSDWFCNIVDGLS
ncbi:hypothetical protein BGZ76_006132, partial [Entomortierella beljakovae]